MRTRLCLLGGQAIALGLMMAFLVVPVSALFLTQFGASSLPYVYLCVAASGVVVTWAMSRAQRHLALSGLAEAVLVTYLVLVVTGWVVLSRTGDLRVTFPLLVLFPLSIPVGFVLVGSQAGRLLDVRQMKAHFPRVAAGFSVGFAIGGFTAAALVGPLGGPVPLLGLDVLATLLMLGLVVATARHFPGELRAHPGPVTRIDSDDRAVPARDRARKVFGNRLVRWIFAYQLLSAAVTQLLDYLVWERAAVRYPDPSDLARFQGIFGAVLNVASVAFVVVVAGWLLTRYGIGLGLLANPVGVLVLLVATSLAGWSAGVLGLVFFGLVCAQQVTDIALTDGTTRTSINATYQALLPDQRLRAQTFIEGAGVPMSLGLVGLVLIGIEALQLGVLTVVTVTLCLSVLWLAAAVLAYREYGANLRQVLSARAWDPVDLRLDDDLSRSAVEHLLASEDARDIHAGLDALVDAGHGSVSLHVVDLLEHEDPVRRQLAVEVAFSARLLGDPPVVEAVRGLLADPDPSVALRAAAALVRLPRGEREDGRASWLAALAAEDMVIRRAALDAATVLPHRFFVPYLVGLASSVHATSQLLDALSAHADELADLGAGLLGDVTLPGPARERVLHVLGQATTPEARDLLLAHRDDGDPAIVEAATRILLVLGHGEVSTDLRLEPHLRELALRIGRCLHLQAALEERPGTRVLRDALADHLIATGGRVELLLDRVHDPRAIGSGFAGLAATDERARSSALEMLEVTVGRAAARIVLLAVDPRLDPVRRRALAASYAPLQGPALGDLLEELIRDDDHYWNDPWLQACALYVARELLPAVTVHDLAARHLHDLDQTVVETARWTLEPDTGAREPVPG